MAGEYVVYGSKGSGSVAVEAALTLLALPYRVVEVNPTTGDAELLRSVNPIMQVPALVLPGGALMTESAAILIWLADEHPEGRLSPTMAARTRPAFLRWMALVSSVYALYWIRDDTSRVVDDPDLGQEVGRRIDERMLDCWRVMDEQTDAGRYILGDDLTVLDLYVTVVTRWRPGRTRISQAAPKLADVIRRVDADPRLTALWAERFPPR